MLTRTASVFAFCLLIGFASSVFAHAPASPEPESYTVLYLSDAGPLVLKFRIVVGEQPLEKAWIDYVAALFESLDANQNDELDAAEAAQIPPAATLRTIGILTPTGTPMRVGIDHAPRDGKVTRTELTDYFRSHGGGPFTARVLQSPQRGRRRGGRGEQQLNLFAILDRNKDQRLTADEFAFDRRLLLEDKDDDESLSQAELLPFTSPFFTQIREPAVDPSQDGMLIVLDGRRSTIQTAREVLAKYDGRVADKVAAEKDRKLTAAELGASPPALASFDADDDGALDFDELSQWLRAPTADARLTVQLRPKQGENAVSMEHGSGLLAGRFELADSDSGQSLVWGKNRLEFRGSDVAADPDALTKQFGNADMDGNGYLEEPETQRYGIYVGLFAVLDVDRDGKVFKTEVETFVKRFGRISSGRVSLDLSDQGRKLFELLDGNSDGRLSDRELQQGAQRIPAWDENGDGAIVAEEIPNTKQFSLSPAQLGRRFDVVRVNATAGVSDVEVGGPLWFARMDRNRDGVVSRREFLPPIEMFDALDADQDGLLTAAEAKTDTCPKR